MQHNVWILGALPTLPPETEPIKKILKLPKDFRKTCQHTCRSFDANPKPMRGKTENKKT